MLNRNDTLDLVDLELLLVSSPVSVWWGGGTEGEPETEVSGEQASRHFQFRNVLFHWTEGYFGRRFEKLHNPESREILINICSRLDKCQTQTDHIIATVKCTHPSSLVCFYLYHVTQSFWHQSSLGHCGGIDMWQKLPDGTFIWAFLIWEP